MARRALAITAVALHLLAAAALAGDEEEPARVPEWTKSLRVRGRVAEDVAYRLHDPGDIAKLRTTGWLDGKYTFSEAASLRVAARAWYDAAVDATGRYPANVARDQRTELDLREALLSASSGAFDVRLGRQQIVWGEAIGTFVTDVVNPKDFREFVLPDFSEIRIPIWAVDATYRLGRGVSVEGVWTPDARFNKLPKLGAEFQFAPPAYRFGNPVVRLPDNPDEFTLARSEGGFRLSVLAGGWDTSLIYYDEADKNPVFFQRRVPQFRRPDVIELEPRHARLHVVGATLAKSLEPVVLRSEVALAMGKRYVTTDPRDGDGLVRRDTLDYLIGVDYTIAEAVDVGLQLGQKILMGPATNVAGAGVEARVTTSATLRVATGFLANTLSPTLLFVVNANRADYRVSVKIDYAVTGALTLSIGADVFEGPRRTLYGQFDGNDRVFVTTTWRF
jgi:Protein of unknown function (DUF1302)